MSTRFDPFFNNLVHKPKVFAVLSVLMRAMISVIFVLSGTGKLFQYSNNAIYMQSQGISPNLLPLAILVELGCGLMVLLGFQTRIAAFLLFGFTVVTAILFHTGSDMNSQIMFMKNISMAGGLLALVVFGAGGLSIDRNKQ